MGSILKRGLVNCMLVSVLVILNTYFCSGQLNVYPSIGLNYSSFGNVDYPPMEVKNSWIFNPSVGIGIEKNILSFISITGEISWNIRGGRSTLMPIGEPDQEVTYRLSYLSLPAKVSISTAKVGIYFGIEYSRFVYGSIQFFKEERNRFVQIDGRKPEKKYDLAGNGGVIIHMSNRAFINLCYTHGFVITHTYTPQNINGVIFSDGVEYNRVLSISIGFYLKNDIVRGK